MLVRAFTIAVLCFAVATAASAGPGNGKGPDGNGPPGHAGDPPSPPAPPAPPAGGPMSPEGQITIGADQNIARDALDAGKVLPLADISVRIAAALDVRVIDARLVSSGGVLVYRLVVLSRDGVSRRIYVDARTGGQVGDR
jgi:hypothetical protein